MIILAILHLLLIFLVPWTSKWIPAIAIAIIDSADLFAILAIVAVIDGLVEVPETAEK